ncbi:hypothetical protein [Chryseobacterium sp. SIMBA_038]|uniref:hypothetical protein n=1 Tax=Chryseobacterium sp. SIMBA_038 TaxID=3085780 RepID=UPI0039781649
MYKNLFFLISTMTLISCHNEDKFELNQNINEFDDIIEAVINNDSLKVFKNNKENNVVIEYLEKQKISDSKEYKIDGIIQVTPPNDLSIGDLFNLWQVDAKGFDKKDSLYLLSQNTNPDSLKISGKLLSKIEHLPHQQTLQEWKKDNYLKYFTFCIPIISKDKSKAYVESGYHCGGLCGSGRAYFLEKINKKWKVVKKWGTWIS